MFPIRLESVTLQRIGQFSIDQRQLTKHVAASCYKATAATSNGTEQNGPRFFFRRLPGFFSLLVETGNRGTAKSALGEWPSNPFTPSTSCNEAGPYHSRTNCRLLLQLFNWTFTTRHPRRNASLRADGNPGKNTFIWPYCRAPYNRPYSPTSDTATGWWPVSGLLHVCLFASYSDPFWNVNSLSSVEHIVHRSSVVGRCFRTISATSLWVDKLCAYIKEFFYSLPSDQSLHRKLASLSHNS